MPSEVTEESQYVRSLARADTKSRQTSRSGLIHSTAVTNAVGTCLACGPDHQLQIRELSRCGFRGEGYGAWCGSCRRVYALEDNLAPAA